MTAVEGRAAVGERIGEAVARAVASPVLEGTLISVGVRVSSVDPVSLFAAMAEADLEAALWLRPSEGLALVGAGRAWAAEGEGPSRFHDGETAWRDLVEGARLEGEATPTLLGGLGFTGRRPADDDPWAPFGPSSLVLPQLLLTMRDGVSTLTTSAVGAPDPRAVDARWERLAERANALTPPAAGMVARPVFAPLRSVRSQPDQPEWHRAVATMAGAVGRGRLDKVVLARRVDLRSPVELDVPNALRRLAASAPESTIYAFRRAGRTFLGATPERLVRVEGRRFRTAAIAGTIGRGADAAEDEQLARDLLASEKDREEHAIVVHYIRDLLASVAAQITVAPAPSVMRLRFVQHLATEIEGTLPADAGLLALGERLHPTPAVGGDPRDAALAMINEHEGFDRGWYAGPVGWMNGAGDGELCVALRCGVVDHTRAALFAGCGIVADSDPAREWDESRIKLRAVVSALGMLEDEA
jgi:menaquinone-specific isochorismate synthase